MKTPQPLVTVDMWSDLVCPWCWIAKKRFERALNELEFKDQVQVNYHAYRIGRNLSPKPFGEILAFKLGSISKADAMMENIKKIAASEGLEYNFETMLFGDSLKALALVHAAKEINKEKELLEKLFIANTTQGRSIFTTKSLVQISREIGINREFVESSIQNPAYQEAVLSDELKVSKLGASGVPLFMFNEQLFINGAQDTQIFIDMLQTVYKKTSKYQENIMNNSTSCTIDSCSL